MAYNQIIDSTQISIAYTEYPITVAQAKDYCRVDGDTTDEQDALFAMWIRLAFTKVENYTGISLTPKNIVAILSAPQGMMELPFGPVTNTPTFVDAQGVAMTVYLQGLQYKSIVYCTDYTKATYTAGYADGEIPDELIEAMYLIINYYYENRGDVEPTSGLGAGKGWVPQAIAICQKWKRPSI